MDTIQIYRLNKLTPKHMNTVKCLFYLVLATEVAYINNCYNVIRQLGFDIYYTGTTGCPKNNNTLLMRYNFWMNCPN